jgi:hypothetical protein
MISSIATALSAGAAEAHPVRGGGGGYHGGGGTVVRNVTVNRGGGGYYGARGGYVGVRGGGYYGGYARRPIYMHAPVIREHYYNYYRRPAIVVENYAAMDGYVWVRGGWQWNGYEWIWAPGHYQPMY